LAGATPLEEYLLDDAEYVIVSAGALTSNAAPGGAQGTPSGIKVGCCASWSSGLSFAAPGQALAGAGRSQSSIATWARGIRIFAAEIRSAMYGVPGRSPSSVTWPDWGRDVRVETVAEILDDLIARDDPDLALFVGVKGLPIGPVRTHLEVLR
jgi:hypothetical protein